jgi:serine/threonine-protein kinase
MASRRIGAPYQLMAAEMSQGFEGEQLGSFRLEQTIGSGAMGVVFRATHETTGRPAAVKIVHGELSQKGKVFERFEREAEILKQFRHPNIVRWLAWGRFRGTSYFAMEFVEGVTLEKIVQERGELPWREVVDLGIQLCNALQYAHELQVVHRDLKPSNIMVTVDGKLKLTDFGIAKDLDRTTQLTAPGRTLGTAAYMAPEQIRGTPAVSHKTDLYALGVLFYQMLTGKAPFDGSSAVVLMHCHLNEPPPRPGDKVEELPKALNELVVNLMAKSPTDRPWDAAAVEQVLTDLRDRDERGEPIEMVWPKAGSSQANPIRTDFGTSQKKGRTGKRKRRSSTPDDTSGSRLLSRGALEVAGLVAALLAIGGVIGYALWPVSAQYLYHQAELLMATGRSSDRLTARDEYLDPLDRRFPDHPYKAKTQEWRDIILLEEAERRAKTLSSQVKLPPMTDPQNDSEFKYVNYDSLATKAAADGNEIMAANSWKEMAGQISDKGPEERKWHLLAVKRAEQLETKIRERRANVIDMLRRAESALLAGRPNEALSIRASLNETYGRYTDLADLLGPPPAVKPPAENQETAPVAPSNHASQPAPGSPSSAIADQEPASTPKTSEKPPGDP